MYRMRVCVVVRGGDKTKVHKEDGCGHGREGGRERARKMRARRRQSMERVLAIRALFAVNTHSERSGHLSALSFKDDTQDRILKQRQDEVML